MNIQGVETSGQGSGPQQRALCGCRRCQPRGQGRPGLEQGGQPFPMPRLGSPSTTRVPQNTLTGNSVADPDKDFLKVGEVVPGRLEHVHEAVDEQVLHPAERDTRRLHTAWPASPHTPWPASLHTLSPLYTPWPTSLTPPPAHALASPPPASPFAPGSHAASRGLEPGAAPRGQLIGLVESGRRVAPTPTGFLRTPLRKSPVACPQQQPTALMPHSVSRLAASPG